MPKSVHILARFHSKIQLFTCGFFASEYSRIKDCLQKVKDYFINTVSYLQEAENKLYAASCRQDGGSQIQNAQNASSETAVCCSEGEVTGPAQASSNPSQQSQGTPSLNKTESQNVNEIQKTETKTVEIDVVASSAENTSAGEQDIGREPPMKKQDGKHNSVAEKKDCNRKNKLREGSSATKNSPELAFQHALTSSGEGNLSETLEVIYDRTVQNLSEQDKKAIVKESSKRVESEEHSLAEQTGDSKMETNPEICRNNQITFTASAQTGDVTTVNTSLNDSEEAQKSRHWMNKE